MILTNAIIHALKEAEMDIEQLFILYTKRYVLDWTSLLVPRRECYDLLRKKEYLSHTNQLTPKATSFLDSLYRAQLLQKNEAFDIFWNLFPDTDAHAHWTTTRKMKSSKKACETLFNKYVKSKEATAEEIIMGLTNEVAYRKNTSLKENNLKYMKNSLRWLKEREFDLWPKLSNEEHGEHHSAAVL